MESGILSNTLPNHQWAVWKTPSKKPVGHQLCRQWAVLLEQHKRWQFFSFSKHILKNVKCIAQIREALLSCGARGHTDNNDNKCD